MGVVKASELNLNRRNDSKLDACFVWARTARVGEAFGPIAMGRANVGHRMSGINAYLNVRAFVTRVADDGVYVVCQATVPGAEDGEVA